MDSEGKPYIPVPNVHCCITDSECQSGASWQVGEGGGCGISAVIRTAAAAAAGCATADTAGPIGPPETALHRH